MYNEQIEALISAALADGALTEKERQVLFKKAQSMGIDIDEFEMVLDARLMDLKKKEKSQKSNKHGDVRKCPACGAIVPSLTVVCTECGFEFSGIEANYSSQKLAKEIIETQAKYNDKINRSRNEDEQWELKKQTINTIAQIIKSFPLPTTKADLFEFIATMQVKMLDTTVNKQEGAAYFAKYNEAIIKAGVLFNDDPLFFNFIRDQDNVIAKYNENHKKQKGVGLHPDVQKLLWICMFWGTVALLIIAVICILWYLDPDLLLGILSVVGGIIFLVVIWLIFF